MVLWDKFVETFDPARQRRERSYMNFVLLEKKQLICHGQDDIGLSIFATCKKDDLPHWLSTLFNALNEVLVEIIEIPDPSEGARSRGKERKVESVLVFRLDISGLRLLGHGRYHGNIAVQHYNPMESWQCRSQILNLVRMRKVAD